MDSHQLVVFFWLTGAFLVGACLGSLINVVVARLPLEKSIIWPGSRCGSCLQSIRGLANIPIFSYLALRGRCRTCGARFSSRYMWVELGTAVAFAGLFYLDVFQNWNQLPFVQAYVQSPYPEPVPPIGVFLLFVHHATLLVFLIAAALCDIDGRTIPLSLTLTGTLIGLVFATLLPWPWPQGAVGSYTMPSDRPWIFLEMTGKIPRGIYNWPVWGPLPDWLPRESWQLGLMTGLAGAAAGNLMMRGIKFLFEQGMGKEALGLGDADLMMMAGAFLGWQMIVVAFFIGTFVALFIAIPLLLRRGQRVLPFGPGLAIGVVITLFCWRQIGPSVQRFFFEWLTLVTGVAIFGGGIFIASLLLGRRK
jgi:leader peptidase (prepilin peptidase)/N-methyltransferase